MRILFYFLFFMLPAAGLHSQILINANDIWNGNKMVCDSLKPVDETYFLQHSLPYTIIDTSHLPRKNNHTLEIPYGVKTLQLTDNITDSYVDYSFAGQDKKRNWVLIKAKTYDRDFYYLVNQKTQKIDTLVGYPLLVKDKLICLEDLYTEGTDFIEVWDVKGNELKLTARVSFKKCGHSPTRIALSKTNELLIRDITSRFWKYQLR